MTARAARAACPSLAAAARPATLRWLLPLAALVVGASHPARAERFMDTGIPVIIKEGEITLATKTGAVVVPLPQQVEVFVAQAASLDKAEPGDTVALDGVLANGTATPTLEASQTFIVRQPVPDAARRALALRFLPPAPKDSPPALKLGLRFRTWSGVVSRLVEGGIELKRDDGTMVVARPGLDDGNVGLLQPGSRADLPTGRLRLFGDGDRVTAIIVVHRGP